MKESKVEINKRKIRNGIRKQAEAIQREKEKIWNRLKEDPARKTRRLAAGWTIDAEQDLVSFYGLGVSKELADALVAEIRKDNGKNTL